jgi:O-antigen/teichoic acid export membrane protein
MIIEFLGPPGSGKTTFAHELARRLRARGYNAKVMLTYEQGAGKYEFDRLGVLFFVSRILSAVFATAGIIVLSLRRREQLDIANSLVTLMPPASRIWRARLWQYILQLGWRWTRAKASSDITIFDQGFMQAVGSLAMFHGSADTATLTAALDLLPESDLSVRITAPLDVVENRLHARIKSESPAERYFEAEVSTNLTSVAIFDRISVLLARTGRKMVSVETLDKKSTVSGMRRVEAAVLDQLAHSVCGRSAAPSKLDAHGQGGNAVNMDAISAVPAQPRNETQVISAPAARAASQPGTHAPFVAGKRLALGSVFAFAIYVGGAGLTSVAQLLIARLVGPASYGIYAYALAWITMIAYLSTLGFNVSLLRFVPAYRAKGRHDLARGIIGFAARRALLAAALAAAAGAAFALWASPQTSPELKTTMLIGMAAIPLITAYALGATLLRAFGGVISALLPERVLRDGLLLALFAIAAHWGHQSLDAPLVMKIVLVSSFATFAVVVFLGWRAWPAELATKPALLKNEWWATVPPIMIIVGLDVLLTRTGVMVLGWTGNVRDAGIFALALNVALLVGLSRVAVSTMFSPAAATLYEHGDIQGLQQLFSRSTLLCFAGAVAIALPLLIIIDPLLDWFGSGFDAGAPIAQILILGYVLTAFCGPQQNLLMMTGNEWIAAQTMLAGVVSNILACAVGITLYGLTGAALGVSFAQIIWNIAMALYIRKRLNIMPGMFHAAGALRFA